MSLLLTCPYSSCVPNVLQVMTACSNPSCTDSPHLYTKFILTRSLSGIEKACLLMRGSKELDPDVPDADLKPLAEDEDFKKNSSLKSLWKALQRDPAKVPTDEFYFIRVEGPYPEGQKCTGLVLLQLFLPPTQRTPYHQFDIKGFCSTGTGMGALLMFKLLSVLKAYDADTYVHVRLHKCIVNSAGFYTKMGFERINSSKPAKAGDAMFLDMSTDAWKEMATERMGGEVQVLEETEALPVSTQDGLVNSIWTWTDVDEERPEEIPSSSVQQSVTTEPSAAALFGEGALLLGRRVTVRGNGTCWLYAVMAGLGVLQHANSRPLRGTQREMKPTDEDYKLSALFLSKMKAEVKQMKMKDHEDIDAKIIATKTQPTSPCWGGGPTDYACLSFMLQCCIVVLNLAKPSKTMCYRGNSKGGFRTLSQSALAELLQSAVENSEATLVVEYDGHAHYAAYESPESYMPEHPLWLKAALGKRPVR